MIKIRILVVTFVVSLALFVAEPVKALSGHVDDVDKGDIQTDLHESILRLLLEPSTVSSETEALRTLEYLSSYGVEQAIAFLNFLKGQEIDFITKVEGEGKFKKLFEMAEDDNSRALMTLGSLHWLSESFGVIKKGQARNFLKRASKLGNGDAMLVLYYYYMQEERNEELAFNILNKAANEVGHADSMFALAMHYKDIKNDKDSFIRWITEAAAKDNKEATKIFAELKHKFRNEKEEENLTLSQRAKSGSIEAKKHLIKSELTKPATKYQVLESAALTGDPKAQFDFSKYLYKEEKNIKMGKEWLRKSAKQNYPDALTQLAVQYEKEDFNYEEANRLYKKAVALGNVRAMSYLATNYRKGLGTKKNLSKAIHLLHKAADGGEEHAQHSLGYLYENGEGVAEDMEKSIYYYTLASDAEYVPSIYNLGMLYAKGVKVKRQPEKSIKLLTIAANKGDPTSQAVLGKVYLYGDKGVTDPDLPKSFKWFLKASMQGEGVASRSVGTAYLMGWGVEKDFKLAHKFFEKGVSEGDLEALFGLGVIYRDGRGVTKDMEKAKFYLLKAARADVVKAQASLAGIFGTESNDKEFKYWLNRAAAQGHKKSQSILDKLNDNDAPSLEADAMAVKAFFALKKNNYDDAMKFANKSNDIEMNGKALFAISSYYIKKEKDAFQAYKYAYASYALGFEKGGKLVDGLKKALSSSKLAQAETEARRLIKAR
jgi:uncharacterized protein